MEKVCRRKICIIKITEMYIVNIAKNYNLKNLGRFNYKSPSVFSQLERKNCIAIRYVDDSMKHTEEYPMNPNGSKCMFTFFLSLMNLNCQLSMF